MYATAGQYLGFKKHSSKLVVEDFVQEPFLDWNEEQTSSTADPKIWGPAFWFSLHNSAAHYPTEASPIVCDRMKTRILAIPYEIPCSACRPHASAFIEANKDRLGEIVKGRDGLVKFYVDFHNKVNERYGKRQWTYEEAKEYYSGNAKVSYLKKF